VLQKTKENSKATKNKLIVANQLLLKDNYVSNVIKQKVLCKYLRLGEFIYTASYRPAYFTGSKFAVTLSANFLIREGISIFLIRV
jgi:hypothetical protein